MCRIFLTTSLPGFGENIRGAALGSTDRAAHSEAGERKHDEVAAKGRKEIAEGMAKIKGHRPQPAGTTQSTAGQETGTGAGPGSAAGEQAAGAGPTGQGQQTEKGYGASAAEERSGVYSGPGTTGECNWKVLSESTRSSFNEGSGAAQTGHEGLNREATTGAGAVHEQKKQEQRDPGFASAQEGKGYDQDVQERSRNLDTDKSRAQVATDNRSQQRNEQPSQHRAEEQRATGQINFQGIPLDEG